MQLCTQFDNYGPRKIHQTGMILNPYVVTVNGVVRANGQRYLGDTQSATQPYRRAVAAATPGCRTCHGGC